MRKEIDEFQINKDNFIKSTEGQNLILIAEFMGKTVYDGLGNDKTKKWKGESRDFEIHELKYSTSWDWLMPVVSKIKDVAICDEDSGTHDGPSYGAADGLLYQYIDSDINDVYESVIEFIKWHNKNN